MALHKMLVTLCLFSVQYLLLPAINATFSTLPVTPSNFFPRLSTESRSSEFTTVVAFDACWNQHDHQDSRANDLGTVVRDEIVDFVSAEARKQ
jgi:hypothetical protein